MGLKHAYLIELGALIPKIILPKRHIQSFLSKITLENVTKKFWTALIDLKYASSIDLDALIPKIILSKRLI